VRPQIAQLIKHIDVSEWTEHALHETRFPNGLLNTVKSRMNDTLRSDNTSHATRDLTEHVETTSYRFLTCGDRACDLFDAFQSRINYGHW
jgi:hypothetical protein